MVREGIPTVLLVEAFAAVFVEALESVMAGLFVIPRLMMFVSDFAGIAAGRFERTWLMGWLVRLALVTLVFW